MNKMKPHSASQHSYDVRKLIVSLVDKPMRYIDIQTALYQKQRNTERTKPAHISNHLTRLVQVGCLEVRDTKAKAQDRYWYTWTGVEYEPTVFKGDNVGKTEIRHEETAEGSDKASIQKKLEEERAKNCFAYGSAMRNVANLAEKLKAQSRLMRRDNERQLGRQRIGVGISQVYEG